MPRYVSPPYPRPAHQGAMHLTEGTSPGTKFYDLNWPPAAMAFITRLFYPWRWE